MPPEDAPCLEHILIDGQRTLHQPAAPFKAHRAPSIQRQRDKKAQCRAGFAAVQHPHPPVFSHAAAMNLGADKAFRIGRGDCRATRQSECFRAGERRGNILRKLKRLKQRFSLRHRRHHHRTMGRGFAGQHPQCSAQKARTDDFFHNEPPYSICASFPLSTSMPVHAPIWVSKTTLTLLPSAFLSSAMVAASCSRESPSGFFVGRP